MKINTGQPFPVGRQPTGPKEAKNAAESLEAKKLQLKKATRDFESFFVLYILKAMRSTIPRTGFLESGLGQDIYNSMFDMELAKRVSGSSSQSLSEILYRSLERQLVAVDGTEKSSPSKPNTRITRPMNEGLAASAKVDSPANISLGHGRFPSRSPKITSDPILKNYGSTIDEASRHFNLDPKLVYSVIRAESAGDSRAVSTKGAKGLMQLLDNTAVDMGVADSLNPRENIWGGAKYLRGLLDRYGGNLRLALAAYNAGPGNVSKYNGVPPFTETKKYIEKVLEMLHSTRRR